MIYYAFEDHDGMIMLVIIEKGWSGYAEFMSYLDPQSRIMSPHIGLFNHVQYSIDYLSMERGYEFFPRLSRPLKSRGI